MLKNGERYEIEIIDMGSEGEGIGRIGRLAVFVPGAVLGDRVLAEIVQSKKSFARAKIIEYTEPSPKRCAAFCPIEKSCGGCSLQHLLYSEQLKLKQRWVYDRLVRIGGVENPLVHETLGMEEPYAYRNKAVMAAGRATGEEKKQRGCRIGYYSAGSRQVVDCESCGLQADPAERIASSVRNWIRDNKVPVYDMKSGTGVFRNVVVRTAFGSGEVMVILVATEKRLPETDALVEAMNAGLEALSAELNAAYGGENGDEDYGYYLESVILNVNKQKGSQVFGEDCITLAGKPTIKDFAFGLELEISPLSFYQVNTMQAERLYEKAAEYAGLTGTETVLDLYCGVGTIGLSMAHRAGKVLGIESVKAAVLDANRNAVLNGIVNAEYILGKAEDVLPPLAAEGLCADVVILDPPRRGCEPELLKAAAETGAERIVYVSCDPATLARDVKLLGELGYVFAEAQPVDMFPHTTHVETVCLLSKLQTKQHIEIKLDMDELDLTDAEKKATYQEIKDYVLEHSGLKVSSLYIAQVKQKCGIIERENYNKPKSEDAKQPQCPPDKEKAIKEALTHFGMI